MEKLCGRMMMIFSMMDGPFIEVAKCACHEKKKDGSDCGLVKKVR